MSCTLIPAPDGSHILMKIVGDITAHSMLGYVREINILGRTLGIHRHLVDLTECRNVSTATENYDFSSRDMRSDPDIDLRVHVVLLVSPEDHSHDFSETVARNNGLDVTLFRDREQALAHLLAGPPE